MFELKKDLQKKRYTIKVANGGEHTIDYDAPEIISASDEWLIINHRKTYTTTIQEAIEERIQMFNKKAVETSEQKEVGVTFEYKFLHFL